MSVVLTPTPLLDCPRAAMRAWRSTACALALAVAFASLSASPASAGFDTTTTTDTTLLDPLFDYCTGCTDSSVNTYATQLITNFGFTGSASSSPVSGDSTLDVLIPNNNDPSSPGSISLNVTAHAASLSNPRTVSANATLDASSAWPTGNLSDYLSTNGVSNPSPTNPIGANGACRDCAKTFDLGGSGFFVYQVNLDNTTLLGMNQPGISPLLNIGPDLSRASDIVAFLNSGPN